MRKQRNPLIELMFFAWCYISFKSEFKLPAELSIKSWLKSYYSINGSKNNLDEILKSIEKKVPQLKNCFSLLYDSHINKFRRDDFALDWELYGSVFSRFPFEEASNSDWKVILNQITEDILKKQKTINADPIDISKLAANVFIGQLNKKASAKKEVSDNTVFISPLSTGTIAVEINDHVASKWDYSGSEYDLEIFCIAVVNFLINEIDTAHLYFGEKENQKRKEWEYIISFLNSSYLDNPIELEKWFHVIAFNSLITIAITSQSFLFSKRFSMIRRQLINDSHLVSVVSLAPSIYANTRTKSAMLVFNRAVKSDKILLVNGENLDWNTKRVVKYSEKEINFLNDIITHEREFDNISKLFDVRDLRTDDYSLLVSKRLPEEQLSVDWKKISNRIVFNQQQMMGDEILLQSYFNKLIQKKQ